MPRLTGFAPIAMGANVLPTPPLPVPPLPVVPVPAHALFSVMHAEPLIVATPGTATFAATGIAALTGTEATAATFTGLAETTIGAVGLTGLTAPVFPVVPLPAHALFRVTHVDALTVATPGADACASAGIAALTGTGAVMATGAVTPAPMPLLCGARRLPAMPAALFVFALRPAGTLTLAVGALAALAVTPGLRLAVAAVGAEI